MRPVRVDAVMLYNSLNVGDKISWKNKDGNFSGVITEKRIENFSDDDYYCVTVDNSSEHLVYPQTQETLDRWKVNLPSKGWIEEFKTIRKISSLDEVKPVRFDPNKMIDSIDFKGKISFIDYKSKEKRTGIVLAKGIRDFEDTQRYYFISVRVKHHSPLIYVTHHIIYPQNNETLAIWKADDTMHALDLMKEFESVRKIE